MKLLLAGYMGSGKSVIGKLLAEKLAISHYDLDQEIEKIAKSSIKNIFSTKGELFFRKLEREVLIQILSQNTPFVLSLGGGTPCYFDNYKLFQTPEITSIYLKATVETLANRLEHQKNKRPLIADLSHEALHDYIAKHLFDRNFYYHQMQFSFNVDHKTINEIVPELIQKYQLK